MPVYVIFGDVWEDSYGIDVRCFGVYTSPEEANEVLESLKKKKTLRKRSKKRVSTVKFFPAKASSAKTFTKKQ